VSAAWRRFLAGRTFRKVTALAAFSAIPHHRFLLRYSRDKRFSDPMGSSPQWNSAELATIRRMTQRFPGRLTHLFKPAPIDDQKSAFTTGGPRRIAVSFLLFPARDG
jgi:hypothetical protein